MSGNTKPPNSIQACLGEAEEIRLFELLEYLEDKIPAAYRAEMLSFLLPRAFPDGGNDAEHGATAVAGSWNAARPAPGADGREEEGFSNRESYIALFARRGDTLLKALASLRFAETQLGVKWLTPTEIVRLLGELYDDHHVYRSNVSNVLRKEGSLVARRARGRGYEYALTKPGRSRVMRELILEGVDRQTGGRGLTE